MTTKTLTTKTITTCKTLLAGLLVGVTAGVYLSAAATAHAAWPEREIRFVVNYGAGGATDVATRLLARAMEPHLGQAIVIENRPGGQATLGPAYVTRQPADGYTIAITTFAAMALSPHVVPVSYSIDDFAFIGQFGRFRFGLAVKADAPYQTAHDVLAAARQQPLFFGVSGPSQGLAFFEMNTKYDTKFEQILYKSGTEAITALGSGQVQASIQNPSEMQAQVDAGRVRLLASASPGRWHNYPDMPTLKELGIDVEVDSSMAMAAPAGTPAAVRAKLAGALEAAVRDPAFRDGMHALGLDAVWRPGADYDRLMRESYVAMRIQMQAAGMPLLDNKGKP